MKNTKVQLLLFVALIALPFTVYALLQQQDPRSRASTNLTVNAGRPFADDSAWNQPIGSSVIIDPNSASMVGMLANGKQGAALYEFGTPVFFADANTPKYQINCTQDWGTCGLEGEEVPIPDNAQPAPGSDGQMVVVDLTAHKSYEFWQYKNDKASTSWGAILPLDGDGRGSPQNHAVGAGTSRLAGVIRTYEIEQGVIDHALVFATKYCKASENRFPATKDDGKYVGTGAIPEGARIQLDPNVNVDGIPGITKAEKAVAKALQKYGAYAIDCGGTEMAFSFENPIGKNDPYAAAGLTGDYFEMDAIPWDKLRVLAAWNSYTPLNATPTTVTSSSPTLTTLPTPTIIAPTGVTPTIYCVGGVGAPPCAPIDPTEPPTGVPTTLPTVSTTTVPSSTPVPTTPSATPTVDPCNTESQNSIHGGGYKKKKKFKGGRGGGGNYGGFFEAFFRFIFQLIELLLRQPAPQPTPTPAPSQPVDPTEEPTTSPEPTVDPCATPTIDPTVEPTVDVSPEPTVSEDPTPTETISASPTEIAPSIAATPTIFCIGNEGTPPCVPSETPTTAPTLPLASGTPASSTNPTTSTTPNPTTDPCNLESQNSTQGGGDKRKNKFKNGGGFFEAFFRFMFRLIELIIQRPVTSQPTPTPTPTAEPTLPSDPTGEPSEEPTASASPSLDPTVEPTVDPCTIPSVDPSVTTNPLDPSPTSANGTATPTIASN